MALIYGGGTDAERQAISRGVRAGKFVKLHSGIYTDETGRDPSAIIRDHLWEVASFLFPGGVISHRTAVDPRPTKEGFFFVTYKRNRKIELPGVTLVEIKGPGPMEGDLPVASLNLFQSQYERRLLENLQISKGKVLKALGREAVEQELYHRLMRSNEKELNRIRDRARLISKRTGMDKEFVLLDGIIGALLTTHPVKKLSTAAAKALARGEPYDPARIEMFESLAIDLSKETYREHKMPRDKETWLNLSFFEAYFSNYIEGTVFTVEEAKKVTDSGNPIAARQADSHDVLGTFQLTSARKEMQRVPTSGAHLIELLQERHAVLLKARPEKGPGMFKQRNNQAGAYEFVDHKLVAGTIKKAFTYYDFLRHPVARAFYIMFITAEIHPFEDGNGRIARIMMNAELTAAKLTKMVIPAVYRTDYLGALRAMSLRYNSIPYIRMLGRAFDFSATLNQKDFETMRSYLKSSNAFETDEGSILRF